MYFLPGMTSSLSSAELLKSSSELKFDIFFDFAYGDKIII